VEIEGIGALSNPVVEEAPFGSSEFHLK
jgi:hypothetical protein